MAKKSLDKEDILARYRRFRPLARKINDVLLERLPKGAAEACGERLGVLEGHTLYLDEAELTLFFDYCLYHYRSERRNTIEAALAETIYPVGSDEHGVLEVMQQAFPSLFEVNRAERGYGIWVYEMLREQEMFIIDQGFSHSVVPGLVMGANLMPLAGCYLTSGAAFLLDAEALLQVDEEIAEWEDQTGEMDWSALNPGQNEHLATILVRAALEHEMMTQMRYVDEAELGGLLGRKKPRRRKKG